MTLSHYFFFIAKCKIPNPCSIFFILKMYLAPTQAPIHKYIQDLRMQPSIITRIGKVY